MNSYEKLSAFVKEKLEAERKAKTELYSKLKCRFDLVVASFNEMGEPIKWKVKRKIEKVQKFFQQRDIKIHDPLIIPINELKTIRSRDR